jgi:beta-lactamase regulating signal transducer with metallopeptidase domain
MTQLADLLSPVTLRLLALALLHFLWQGAALAAIAYSLMALCRSASARYAVGVGTLALMLAAPVASFLMLRAQNQSTTAAVTTHAESNATIVATVFPLPKQRPSTPATPAPYTLWLVEAWFAGVLLLSLRSAGGFLLVERLRRKESTPVATELLAMCLSLQRRMGLTRVIRYCESIRLDAPAVAGWIRPVVLLPLTAVTGLSEDQLEAVIAHELAHIQRHDAFVHLFQVGVETLLFYHPAVWWLGKRIRAERENCCDDIAVALCGNPVTFAKALTRMAEAKAAPQMVMAANRSPLVDRIARLLGANRTGESFRGANLSAGVLCLVTALLAGSAFLGNVHRVQAQSPAPLPMDKPVAEPSAAPAPAPAPAAHASRIPDSAFVVRPSDADSSATPTPEPTQTSNPTPAPAPSAPTLERSLQPMVRTLAATAAQAIVQWAADRDWTDISSFAAAQASSTNPSDSARKSYIDSLKFAGLTNLSVDELIGLKVQGVTADYVKSMKDLGMKPDVDELIGMKVQGITPEYVKGMRQATGENLDSDALIGLKVQGVTPEYIAQMHDLGVKTDADDIIGMKVQGVTPDYIRQMRDLGMKADADDIIGMKVQGITPDWVKGMRSLGLKVTSDDAISMKVQGITSEYVKSIQDLGFKPDSDDLIGMKVQGVTAAYIKELQSAGFKVSIDDAIGAKVQGVTPEFIAEVRSHGFNNLTLEKLIELKDAGVFDREK